MFRGYPLLKKLFGNAGNNNLLAEQLQGWGYSAGAETNTAKEALKTMADYSVTTRLNFSLGEDWTAPVMPALPASGKAGLPEVSIVQAGMMDFFKGSNNVVYPVKWKSEVIPQLCTEKASLENAFFDSRAYYRDLDMTLVPKLSAVMGPLRSVTHEIRRLADLPTRSNPSSSEDQSRLVEVENFKGVLLTLSSANRVDRYHDHRDVVDAGLEDFAAHLVLQLRLLREG